MRQTVEKWTHQNGIIVGKSNSRRNKLIVCNALLTGEEFTHKHPIEMFDDIAKAHPEVPVGLAVLPRDSGVILHLCEKKGSELSVR